AQRLAEHDAPVTADVFGITTSTQRDIGIGQVWEMMSDQVDVLLPMVYPSHYPDGSWGYENPNAAPYQIVRRALDAGVERSDTIPDAASIRPWLQAFSMGEPVYGPMHVRAQIDAVYDAGLTEWLLWNPGVRYPAEAFTDANGIEPWFAGMGETLYDPADAAADSARDPVRP
ncbi:MAG: putative glycoside hydrolase, partial [Longimicrobiales bacterium]